MNSNPKLPNFITKTFTTHKHTLGYNPAFPFETKIPFEQKLITEHFKELCDDLRKIGYEDFNIESLYTDLKEAIKEVIKKESKIYPRLCNIAMKRITDEFIIDESVANFKLIIGEQCDREDNTYPSDDEIEAESASDLEYLNGEIYKRRLINSMIQGGAERVMKTVKKSFNEIFDLDHELPELYYKIMALNGYIQFMTKHTETTTPAGKVIVNTSHEKPLIEAKGLIYPVLVFEMAQGLLELIASHSLPEKEEYAQYVMDKADFSMAEAWDNRLGVPIWNILLSEIPEESKKNIYDVFFSIISKRYDEFNKDMKEILSKTKAGKSLVDDICKSIKYSDDYNDFINRIQEKRDNYKDNFWDDFN